jgi:tetratricopeptide (TPR) repeat protein
VLRLLLIGALTLAPLPLLADSPDKGKPEEEAPEESPALKMRQKGYALLKQRKFEEARKALKESLRLDPGDHSTMFTMGQAYHSEGKLKEAVEWYSKTIYALPGHHMAYHNRGIALHALGKLDEALKDLDEAVDLDPKYPFGWHSRASVFLMLNKPEEAIADCNQAIARYPKFSSAYHTLALAYMRLGTFKKAVTSLESAISLTPGVGPFMFRLGVAQSRVGELEKSIKTYNESLAIKAQSAEGKRQKPLSNYLRARAISSRAQSWFLLGKKKKALDDLLESAKLTPEHAYTPIWTYALGGTTAALEKLVKHEYESDEDKWVQQIMRLYLGKATPADLLKEASKAKEDHAKQARTCQVYCYQAMLLERQGKPAEALPLYEKAAKVDSPGYSEHWWARMRIKALKK